MLEFSWQIFSQQPGDTFDFSEEGQELRKARREFAKQHNLEVADKISLGCLVFHNTETIDGINPTFGTASEGGILANSKSIFVVVTNINGHGGVDKWKVDSVTPVSKRA